MYSAGTVEKASQLRRARKMSRACSADAEALSQPPSRRSASSSSMLKPVDAHAKYPNTMSTSRYISMNSSIVVSAEVRSASGRSGLMMMGKRAMPRF